jgi:hypothetical protein
MYVRFKSRGDRAKQPRHAAVDKCTRENTMIINGVFFVSDQLRSSDLARVEGSSPELGIEGHASALGESGFPAATH